MESLVLSQLCYLTKLNKFIRPVRSVVQKVRVLSLGDFSHLRTWLCVCVYVCVCSYKIV